MLLHQPAITLKPLIGEMNSFVYLIKMAPVEGWNILASKSVLEVDVLEAEKIGKR